MAQTETDALSRIMIGAALARAVSTIAELGIADRIRPGEPQSAAYLAETTGCHEDSLYRTLRFMTGHGLFSLGADDRFDHTPLSRALRSDAEGSYRPAARLFHHVFAAWEGLDHSVRTGEPGFNKIFGMPIFNYIVEHPELGPVFDAGMTSMHGHETDAMLAAYDFDGIGVLADIGGGNGSLLGAILQRHPSMRGMLLDLGHVIGRAKEYLQRFNLGDRCAVIEGSFFESVPAGADAYLFRHVLHDWTDEQCTQILRHCRRVIPAHGRVLIVECVVPGGDEVSLAKDMDMTMMVYPGGVERTASEFQQLLQTAGFELASITPTSSTANVIDGRPIAAG